MEEDIWRSHFDKQLNPRSLMEHLEGDVTEKLQSGFSVPTDADISFSQCNRIMN